jgi:chromosome segregation ATPase
MLGTEIAKILGDILHSNITTTFRDLAKLADSTQKELKVAHKEVSALKKQNNQIDMDYHKKEESMNLLKTKVAVIEQVIKQKLSLMIFNSALHNCY